MVIILIIFFIISLFFPFFWIVFFGYLGWVILTAKKRRALSLRYAIIKLIATNQKEIVIPIFYEAAQSYALDNGAELAYKTRKIDSQNDNMSFFLTIASKEYHVGISRWHDGSTFLSIEETNDPNTIYNQFRTKYGLNHLDNNDDFEKQDNINEIEQVKEQAKEKYFQSQKNKNLIIYSFLFTIIMILLILLVAFINFKDVASSEIETYEDVASSEIETYEDVASSEIEAYEDVASSELLYTEQSVEYDVEQTSVSMHKLLRHDEKLLEQVFDQLFFVYEKGGMAGLAAEIQNCYESNLDKKYCFYLDYSARILDARILSMISENAEQHPFFEDDEFLQRIYNNYQNVIGLDDISLINKQLMDEGLRINAKFDELDAQVN